MSNIKKYKKFSHTLKGLDRYSTVLTQRGHITLWFDEDALTDWRNTESFGLQGRAHVYSQKAIECIVTLQTLFEMSLRKAQTFMKSLSKMIKLKFQIPHYSTISRREKSIKIRFPKSLKRDPLNIIFDIENLKIYSDAGWKEKQKSYDKGISWRTIELTTDNKTGAIIASCNIPQSSKKISNPKKNQLASTLSKDI